MVQSQTTIENQSTNDLSITKQKFSHLMRIAIPTESRKFQLVIPGSDTVRSITNILSVDECNAIITATCLSKEGFSRPTAFSKDARDCQRIHTVDKAMSGIMMGRLTPYLPEIVIIDGVRWKLHRFTHHWRYVRYYPGGHFSPHYDGVKMSNIPTPCMSVYTVQIYLNGGESFTGGSTRFYPDYQPDRKESHEIRYGHVSKFDPFSAKDARRFDVEAKTGKALIFNHALNTLHDGSSVTEGVKFIMRGDILYTALPEDIHLLPTVSTVASHFDHERHWCPFTAEKHGTRNHIGEVWYCVCSRDMHGAKLDDDNDGTPNLSCWHNDDDLNSVNELTQAIDMSNFSRANPKVIVLLSGKRASGKDHIGNLLQESLVNHSLNVHCTALGNINKKLYAASVGIDVERLLNDRAFKEQHRVAMVEHHKKHNADDPEWCVKAVMNWPINADILVLSDLRTQSDLIWFQQTGKPVVVLRINAADEARKERGWEPCPIKDNLYTETDLDAYTEWSACWDNSDNSTEGGALLQKWIELTVVPRITSLLPK